MDTYRQAYDRYIAAKEAGRPKEELRGLWAAVEATYGQGSSSAPKEEAGNPWDYSWGEKEVARNRRSDAPGMLVAWSTIHHGPKGQSGERIIYHEPKPLPRSVF